MRRRIIGASAIVIVAALTGAAFAQSTDTYPDRPIKVVVPPRPAASPIRRRGS